MTREAAEEYFGWKPASSSASTRTAPAAAADLQRAEASPRKLALPFSLFDSYWALLQKHSSPSPEDVGVRKLVATTFFRILNHIRPQSLIPPEDGEEEEGNDGGIGASETDRLIAGAKTQQ